MTDEQVEKLWTEASEGKKVARFAFANLVEEEVASQCAEAMMEQCRELNNEAIRLNRDGFYYRAATAELKADVCRSMANIIRKKFSLPLT